MKIVIQPELVSSLLATLTMCLFFMYAGHKIKQQDPLEKPKGVVLVVEVCMSTMQDFFYTIFPNAKMKSTYTPYFMAIALWILPANLQSLLALEPATSNLSVTIALAMITFAMVQLRALQTKGAFKYIKELIWPPTNLLSAVAPLLSLSLRLFGNIVAGGVLMGLVHSATGYLSSFIFSFIPIDIVGPFIWAVLSLYFDIWSACIQTFIFCTLSSVYIALEA